MVENRVVGWLHNHPSTPLGGFHSFRVCIKWIRIDSHRVNIELRDELQKREHLLEGYFIIKSIDATMFAYLREQIFPNQPSEADVKRVANLFSAIKSDCRNKFSPPYIKFRKEQKDGYKSGSYCDKECILKILGKQIKDNIDDNFRKAMSAAKALLKKHLCILYLIHN